MGCPFCRWGSEGSYSELSSINVFWEREHFGKMRIERGKMGIQEEAEKLIYKNDKDAVEK
jgi:hypothetical protein